MRAFTLIELIISIFLFFLLTLFLSEAIYQARNVKFQKSSLIFTLSKVLQADILNASFIKIESKNPNYVRIYLKTHNSLHFLRGCINVIYYISKNQDTLLRLESKEKVKIPTFKENFFLDKFVKGVKFFRVYYKNGRYGVFINNGKVTFFEIYKGMK